MLKLKISPEKEPFNPRAEDDNLSLMVCAHRRYELGDKHAKSILSEKLGIIDHDISLRDLVEKAKKSGIVFYSTPIYLYDHGGLTVDTSPFSCPFDSGQLGEVLVFNDAVRENFGIKRITKKKKEELLKVIEKNVDSEVKTYSSYLEGDIYCYTILDENDEVIDSCGGFYGTDFENNGMKENLPEEFKNILKNVEIVYDWKRNVWKKLFKTDKLF